MHVNDRDDTHSDTNNDLCLNRPRYPNGITNDTDDTKTNTEDSNPYGQAGSFPNGFGNGEDTIDTTTICPEGMPAYNYSQNGTSPEGTVSAPGPGSSGEGPTGDEHMSNAVS